MRLCKHNTAWPRCIECHGQFQEKRYWARLSNALWAATTCALWWDREGREMYRDDAA